MTSVLVIGYLRFYNPKCLANILLLTPSLFAGYQYVPQTCKALQTVVQNQLFWKNTQILESWNDHHKWRWRRDNCLKVPLLHSLPGEYPSTGLCTHGATSFWFMDFTFLAAQWPGVKTSWGILPSLQLMWVLWKETLSWSLLGWRWHFHVSFAFDVCPCPLGWCTKPNFLSDCFCQWLILEV